MTSCDITVTRKRTSKDLTPDLKNAVRTITSKTDTLPVGTFKYKVFKYPGDIDIYEELNECCSYNDARIGIAMKIQKIVKNIVDDPDIIYMEFKAGYDKRFKIYTGVMNGENYDDYNAFLIRRDWENLYNAKFLTTDQYLEGTSLIKDSPTMDDIVKLNEYFRSYWVLRWTSNEVLNGYMVLPGNIRMYLDDALTHGTITKIDTIAMLEDRYVEMTNFFLIKQKDRLGNEVVLSEEMGDYAQSLLGDVYKYYDGNRMKAVKRFWMYLAFKNRICDMNLFTPLFESDIAYASQVIADIEVALTLIDSNKNYDEIFLYKTISNRLSKLVGTYIDKPFESEDFYETREYLDTVKTKIYEQVNNNTKLWLKNNGIDIMSMINE